jgi:uncharacterized protein (DUF1501 family)
MIINRRSLITHGLFSAAAISVPQMSWAAAETEHRFIFILQRGAADGLAILAPTGDPKLLSARGEVAERAQEGTKLNDFFTLHSALKTGAALYAQKQAVFAHALASAYRERSHFDGQNVLETGGSRPYGRSDGWMNRLLTLLPKGENKALALASAIPPALRGPIQVASYAPSRLPDANAALMERVSMLYGEDKELAPLWASALETENMAGMMDGIGGRQGADVGKLAANLMREADGARIMMIETSGWDTHSQQQARLTQGLKGVDDMVEAIRTGLGPTWNKTLVLVATEFGRTVATNGTNGTDHGTAFAAMLFGGSLAKGGHVMADWPGLAQGQLYEGRDLKPTARFEGFVADTLAAHYGIDAARMRRTLFPDYVF